MFRTNIGTINTFLGYQLLEIRLYVQRELYHELITQCDVVLSLIKI